MDLLRLASGMRPLTLTATTTATPQTVTIQQLTHRVPTVISWGDGSSDNVAANYTGTHTHAYATPGTYNIVVHRAQHITAIDIRVPQIGGLNTAQLRASPITDFRASEMSAGCVIRSADMASWTPTTWSMRSMPAGNYDIQSTHMAGWTPTTWSLFDVPAGNYDIQSTHMAGWTPTTWNLFSMPAGNYDIQSVHMAGWTPATWRLYTMPAGSYDIQSTHMSGWTPTTWRLDAMPAGSYDIQSTHMAGWTPVNWWLYTMPAGSYDITGTEFASWTSIRDLRCYSLNPAVPTATVDAWINAIWAARNGYTWASNIVLNIGGTNGAPTGTVQNVCPPTTPAEKLYNLHHIQCVGDTHNVWSPITYTGGSLP